jgi:hypothetical protein
MVGSGLPWFFGEKVSQLKRSHFEDDVFKYLRTNPIAFSDEQGRRIYVLIDTAQIKKSETPIDEQLTFNFRISQSPVSAPDQFRVNDPENPGFVIIKVPMGKTISSDLFFRYTFSSINTFAQNRANLEDFVQHKWQEMQSNRLRMQ